ncbi:hypothetical protein LA20531_10725 [Lactobacillus amylovorus DSM 20531]|jgi:hypothetical protein|uniref:GmrSD restriction endonuclease domain-containing protein n=1 Tax=Lactobacillus amylovorus TaxID=1604 RepID=UPI000704C459|nr:DUF262 domain-containing protein [Lactobacillus amylovorus]ATO52232.1 hypothetical protein LA20531_00145 [Lactobacillus amylovorus DSM 20531]ATO54024.1 hypothetical protein LA20531_10725 [Lactobacillus amylovorus DSM 20531]MCT3592284.1 DUF262 domain-containing protein [Lactobacillus amylovorus]
MSNTNKSYSVDHTNVGTLLHWIEEDKIGLPEMQRPFVWKSVQVRDLIDSLYRGYPIGFIVTWQNPDAALKNGSKGQNKEIIIDGQQRITALKAALEGHKIVDDKYLSKRIYIAFNPTTEEFATRSAAIAKDPKWIPDISIFNQPSFDEFEYVINNSQSLGLPGNKLNAIIQKLKAISESEIGVINLDSKLPIDQVTDIFNRINQKGTRLSSADFAISRLSSDVTHHGNDLRKEIEYFIQIYNDAALADNIKQMDPDFADSEYYQHIAWAKNENTTIFDPDFGDLLHICLGIGFLRGRLSQLISLISGRDFETKTYTEEAMAKSYQKLNETIQYVLNESNFKRYILLLKSLGIVDKSYAKLPDSYTNFGYILYLYLKKYTSFNNDEIEKYTKQWILMSALTKRYGSSPETGFDKDLRLLVENNSNNQLVEFFNNVITDNLTDEFWNLTLPNNLVAQTTQLTNWRIFQMSQIHAKSHAWLEKDKFTADTINEQGNIHHIFPKAYLRKNGFKQSEYNQVANYVWITQPRNLEIGDRAPKDYMTDMETTKYHSGENDQANAIPADLNELDYHQYNHFLNERRKLMSQNIRKFFNSL